MSGQEPRDWIAKAVAEREGRGPHAREMREQIVAVLRERVLPTMVRRFASFEHMSVGTSSNGQQVLWRVRLEGRRNELRLQLDGIRRHGLGHEAFTCLVNALSTDSGKEAYETVSALLKDAFRHEKHFWVDWSGAQQYLAALLVESVGEDALLKSVKGLEAVDSQLDLRRDKLKREEAFEQIRRGIIAFLDKGGDPDKLLARCGELIAEGVLES